MAAIGKRVRLLSEWSQVRILPIDKASESPYRLFNRLVAGSSPARGANEGDDNRDDDRAGPRHRQ